MTEPTREHPPLTAELIGEQLSSVTFVMDYVQLDFDGSRFTLYIWPEVVRAGETCKFGTTGYRDQLCGLIAEKVLSVSSLSGDAFTIDFQNGVQLRTSLRDEDCVGPEALLFQRRGAQPLIVV